MGNSKMGIVSAHRASYFVSTGKDPGRFYVLHKCDVKRCVNPKHLFLGTAFDNMQDKVRKGRCNLPNGLRHWKAKIGPKAAREIKFADAPNSYFAKKFSISISAVSHIRNGRNWKHIK